MKTKKTKTAKAQKAQESYNIDYSPLLFKSEATKFPSIIKGISIIDALKALKKLSKLCTQKLDGQFNKYGKLLTISFHDAFELSKKQFGQESPKVEYNSLLYCFAFLKQGHQAGYLANKCPFPILLSCKSGFRENSPYFVIESNLKKALAIYKIK